MRSSCAHAPGPGAQLQPAQQPGPVDPVAQLRPGPSAARCTSTVRPASAVLAQPHGRAALRGRRRGRPAAPPRAAGSGRPCVPGGPPARRPGAVAAAGAGASAVPPPRRRPAPRPGRTPAGRGAAGSGDPVRPGRRPPGTPSGPSSSSQPAPRRLVAVPDRRGQRSAWRRPGPAAGRAAGPAGPARRRSSARGSPGRPPSASTGRSVGRSARFRVDRHRADAGQPGLQPVQPGVPVDPVPGLLAGSPAADADGPVASLLAGRRLGPGRWRTDRAGGRRGPDGGRAGRRWTGQRRLQDVYRAAGDGFPAHPAGTGVAQRSGRLRTVGARGRRAGRSTGASPRSGGRSCSRHRSARRHQRGRGGRGDRRRVGPDHQPPSALLCSRPRSGPAPGPPTSR